MSGLLDPVPPITDQHLPLSHEAETALLKTRVAQLEHELADQKWMTEAIKATAFGSVAETGQEFLQALLRQLSAILKVRYVFVTEWVSGRTDELRTIAGWWGDRVAEPIEYHLADTPCQKVLHDGEAFFPSGVQQRFPLDKYLSTLDIQSYMGVSLRDRAGRTTGHLCIMDVRPLQFGESQGRAILRIFAARVAAELDRLQIETALREREERFRTLYDDNPSMYFTLSPAGTIRSVNSFGAAQLGYQADELIGRSALAVFDPDDHQTVLAQLKQCASNPHRTFEWEIQKHRKDGTRLWVHERARAIGDTAGALTILIVCEDVTERRKATQLLSTMARESPLPIVGLDTNARVLSWNQAAERLFGWTEQEVTGRELPYIHPDDEAAADALWQAGVRGEIVGPIELRRRRKDGTMLDLLLWPVFVHDALGEMSTAVGVYVDQSELKRARVAQFRSEARLRSFLNALDDLAFEFDEQGTYLNVWTQNDDKLLFPRQELIGKRLTDTFGPEVGGRYVAVVRRVIATGGTEFIEYAMPREGETRHFSGILTRIPPADGEDRATAGCIIRDISDRKRAEDALRESETRLNRFVADAPVGLVILGEDKRVICANKALCELTGYTEQEMIGNTYQLYTHPDDVPANLVLTDEFYRGVRSEYTYEKRYIRKSGEIIWVSVKATRAELPGHRGPLLLAAVQDITERKLAAEEREQLSRDLHDNILQSLYAVGMQLEAGKMAMGKSPKRSKAHMTHAIEHLNHLMLEVRQYITLLTQRTAPKPDFGQSLRLLVASLAATGQATPELQIQEPVLSFVSPMQGEQLLNIIREALSNSMRHAQAARRSVRLSGTDRTIRLVIRDDGIGFSLTRRHPSGHGLTNMAARAKNIGARLTINSAPGKGTRVTVQVPVEKGAADA